MKNFLISINKSNRQITHINYSKKIQILEEENFTILFTGYTNNIQLIKEYYQNEGIKFLKKLDDAFTCFIYDKVKKKLFIAKDKIGIEPLYFTSTSDSIIVGTHLKEFHKIPTFDSTINPAGVGEYLQFGFIFQPNTIFKNSYKVCAGEYICFNLEENSYEAVTYWNLESCYSEPKNTESESIILSKSESLLQEAIEKNRKNSNFGLSLSGGYDSSTLVAIAQKQSEQKIDTFSIGFYDKNIDEAPYAKAIAKHLNTNHHEYYFSENDAVEYIPKICKIYDEPFADHAAMPTILTSQLLKKENISNLIAGDGGDEVFATAENVKALHRLNHTPYFLKKIFAKTISSMDLKKIPYLKNIDNLPAKQNKLGQLLLSHSIPEMISYRNILFVEEELQSHVKEYTKPIETAFDKINFQGYAETVDEVIGSYFKTTMVDGELVKSYSSMNYLDINLSVPFLDIKLVEYMATIPSDIKIKNDIKKYLLKEIAHQYIPKELIERPKSGFNIPYSAWMRGILKDTLCEQINNERLDKDNIFYTSAIINIRDQFYAGNENCKYKLWRIFIFQLWYEDFILSTK